MRKLDEIHIGLASVWMLPGLAYILAGDRYYDASLSSAGHTAILTAFPLTGFAGLTYRFFPRMKQSKAGYPQTGLMQAGLMFWVTGSYVSLIDGNRDIAGFGTLLTLGGCSLLAWIWWRERTPI